MFAGLSGKFVRFSFAVLMLCASLASWSQAGESPDEPTNAPPPSGFLARFNAADRTFNQQGSEKGFAALGALDADPALNPAERAFVHSRLAARYSYANDIPRANREIASAREFRAAATPEQVAALGVDLDSRMLTNAAVVESAKGDTQEAARLQRRAESRAWERARQLSGDKRSAAYRAARSELVSMAVESVQLNIRAGRLDEYRDNARSLGVDLAQLSPAERGRALLAQARALLAAGEHDPALAEASRALELLQAAGHVDSSLSVQLARQTRVIAWLSLERFDECVADAKIMLAQFSDRAVAGAYSRTVVSGFEAACRRDFAAAERFAAETVEFRVRRYGREHYLTKEALAQELYYRLQRSGVGGEEAAIARFVDRMTGTSAQWADASESPQHMVRPAMTKVLDEIHAIVARGQQPGRELAEVGFRITEHLKGASQGAMFDGAARLAASTPELRALVEREQSMKTERIQATSAAYRQQELFRKASQATKPNRDELARLQASANEAESRLARSESALDETRRELASRFPVYREMVNPPPISIDQVRSLLRDPEIYVSQYSTARSGLAWLIDARGRVSVSPSLSRSQAIALAGRFRSTLESLEVVRNPVDRASGERLREALLGDAKAIPAGATLVISADSTMGGIPIAALPVGDGWLVQRWAITSLPGASSLRVLRQRAGAKANAPLVAFGDPAFSDRPEPAPKAVRTLVRSEATDTFDYADLPALPETRAEVKAVAKALGADASSVFLGREASRTRALAMKLDDFRVLHFATHGLKPGEIPRFPKAGLAMTYEGTGLDDSVLTSDDIAPLRLRAEWVVLSACNTGAIDAESQTLSPLARAFFVAGSSALLVTHWAVESESAMRLVVETFRRHAAGQGKAEALAGAQRAMAAGELGKAYTHPYFWAGYFLAGDPLPAQAVR